MKKRFLIVAALAVTFSGAASGMDVATYLGKAEALRARGVTAMLSSDYRDLQSEVRASAAALKQERLAAVQRGQRPAYCPRAAVSLAPEEIFAAAQAVPPARRAATPLRDAIRAALARKYPCGR
jgi:hypothetical protein